MLIRATDPLGAADELLALTHDVIRDESLLLIHAGEILIEVAFDVHTAATLIDSNRLTTAVRAWTLRAEKLLAQNAVTVTPAPPEIPNLPVLEIQRLMLSLQRRWSASDDWQKLAADAALQLKALAAFSSVHVAEAQSDHTPDEHQIQMTGAVADGHAMTALAACRQLLGFDAMRDSHAVLLRQSREKRRHLAAFLLHQANETNDPVPGDPQIGFLALDLLHEESSPAMPVDHLLEQLPMILAASRVADNFQRFDMVITELTAKPLTDLQLQTTASILQRRNAMKMSDTASSDSAETFWQSVLKRSRSGDNDWLEASLQLATIAVQKKKFQDAAKVLNVINALHPDWGTSERKTRAAALMARLESAR